MSVGEIFDVAFRALVALGVPGAGIWYVRERRRSRAADEVAEQTVPAEVRIKDADALNAHIAAIERAFEVERESKDRRIADQDRQIAELKQGRADDAERIAALRGEVQELRDQVTLLASLTKHLTHAEPDKPQEQP